MEATALSTALSTALQADYRQLITDSKRGDTISSQISGLFSAPDSPAVKEAAERAILKIRSFSSQNFWTKIRESPEIIQPFLIACETKNSKLAVTSLGCMQKLLANDAVALERVHGVVASLQHVERMGDEVIKLKVLQTALTLLQSNLRVTDEAIVGGTLGACFRILARSRNTDSVLSTAGATVRQGVTVVFQRLDEECGMQAEDGASPGCDTLAAEKLLKDICSLAHGRTAEWLDSPPLARGFVLDLIELVLSNGNKAFHLLPSLQSQLQAGVCPFVVGQLSDAFAADSSNVVDAAETKQLLRLACTLLHSLYKAIPGCTGDLVRVILRGASSSGTLWQRTQALKSIRHLCADAKLLLHLHEHHHNPKMPTEVGRVVQEIVECFSETVSAYLRMTAQDDPTLSFLAGLYAHKVSNGMQSEVLADSIGGPEEAGALLSMLAIDCMLATTSAFDNLSDVVASAACWEEQDSTGDPPAAEGNAASEELLHRIEILAQLLDNNWKSILGVLYEVLSRADGEALVLELVKGYQRMIQTAGVIGAADGLLSQTYRDCATKARDGFLSSLCKFTLSVDHVQQQPAATGGLKETLAGMGETLAGMSSRLGRSTSGIVAGSGSGSYAVISRDTSAQIPQADADARVLTPKNVQCMRALFNCAHRLCCSLGTSWAIVLSNLVSLDRILQSPHTTTLEISSQTNKSSLLSADLCILQAAANQLFESTSDLPTEAVLGMMSSLRDISTRMLSAPAVRPNHVRLYALERLVEILLVNSHRVQDLWGIFLAHILEVINTARDPNRSVLVQVRTAGMEALDRATVGVLATTISGNESLPVFQRPSGASFSPARLSASFSEDESTAVERMVLLPLEELYKQAREVDVRLGVLRVVMHCLEQNGDHLRTGWAPLLRLLREVPMRCEPDTLALAFQSVQLMCSDYMALLPEELQIGCIQVVTMYASQTTDINISLTSIGLLWNTADLFASSLQPGKSPQGSKDTVNKTLNGESVTDDAQCVTEPEEVQEDLLQSLFSSLQKLSSDSRPEVRNSAVRTLFSVLSSTGERLARTTWDNCLWGILFPLINHTAHMAATSSGEEREAAELGKVKGRSVKMLVHHSRNSEQKQWDETLVLVIQGIGRLLRTFLPVLAQLPRISEGWEEVLRIAEDTLVAGRKELALAAINTLSSILQNQAACDAMTTSMWQRAIGFFASAVEVAATQPEVMPLVARTELAAALESMYCANPSRFDRDGTRDLVGWLAVMLRNPMAEGDAPVGQAVLLPVQKAVLKAMETMAPKLVPQHPELCSLLIDQLLTLLPGEPNSLWLSYPAEAQAELEAQAEKKQGLSATPLLQERVVSVLVMLYKQHAPWQARAERFTPLVLALGNCMLTRWRSPASEDSGDPPAPTNSATGGLWRQAAQALVAVVNAGLPAVNIAYVNADAADPPNEVWDALEVAFGGFLIGPDIITKGFGRMPFVKCAAKAGRMVDCAGELMEGGPANEHEQLREDMELEALVLDTLTDGVLTSAGHAPVANTRRLVQLVEMGVSRGSRRLGSPSVPQDVASSGFPHLCLRKLFVLCSRGIEAQGPHGTMLEVACLTLPLLVTCCAGILTAYLEDEASLPVDHHLPRSRQDLVMCMLEVVSSLKVAPRVVDAAVRSTGSTRLAGLVHACREAKCPPPPSPESSSPPEGPAGRKASAIIEQEATHLLLLYPTLVRAMRVRDARIREVIAGVLEVIGAELGLASFEPPRTTPAMDEQ